MSKHVFMVEIETERWKTTPQDIFAAISKHISASSIHVTRAAQLLRGDGKSVEGSEASNQSENNASEKSK